MKIYFKTPKMKNNNRKKFYNSCNKGNFFYYILRIEEMSKEKTNILITYENE